MDYEVTIIGAGAVGCAIAYELSKNYASILVIEKEDGICKGISSRNSEVIHAGIYYAENSLKAKLCVEGNALIYDFCEKKGVPHKRTTKLIVANGNSEEILLEEIFKKGTKNGAELRFLTQVEAKKLEPNINVTSAIFSPNTGIVDSHSYTQALLTSSGAELVLRTKVVGIEKKSGGYRVIVREHTSEEFSFTTKILVNSAGLYSDEIAKLCGIEEANYTLAFCKGDYFSVQNGKNKLVNRLIYPVVKKDFKGLGVHVTLSLGGEMRLGPDVEFISKAENYSISPNKKQAFYEAVKSFLPFVEIEDLSPEMSGIRPKLAFYEGSPDFVINEESGKNLPNLVNLIGIESPGLTSSLAIAKVVLQKLKSV
ncbi:NAD(P)/FAD-dependent oxidoreductase [bacterium]|nr:NAD(P)/FAD-dependent oxidoreductase [bacterium]